MDTAASTDIFEGLMANYRPGISGQVDLVHGPKQSTIKIGGYLFPGMDCALGNQGPVGMPKDQNVGNHGITNEVVHGRK